jgi:hypothetical protein
MERDYQSQLIARALVLKWSISLALKNLLWGSEFLLLTAFGSGLTLNVELNT